MVDRDRGPAGPAADALAEYHRRRDFKRTAEPEGHRPLDREGANVAEYERPVFVVQKHDARNLHYDFRLELDGVLKSWAVPKGPSLDPADRRLAVMTEDHPLEYATFEGTIPEGEYGGGTVMLWDFGWWEPDLAWMAASRKKAKATTDSAETDPEALREEMRRPDVVARDSLTAGDLKFVLHGQKLTGSWALVQMKGRVEKNWLLLKHKDKTARSGSTIVASAPDSVASGRTMEEIAAERTD